MTQKLTKENQTQFAQAEPILEEVVNHDDEAVILAQLARKKKRRLLVGSIGGLLLLIYLLIRLLPSPTPPEVSGPEPTPSVTPMPVDTTLFGRIQRARENVEAIDFYQADLSFPQIEREIFLDPPDPNATR